MKSKERPKCRKELLWLMEVYDVSLEQLATGFFDEKNGHHHGITSGMKIQAKKMLKEKMYAN